MFSRAKVQGRCPAHKGNKSYATWLDEYNQLELKRFGHKLRGESSATLRDFYEDGYSPVTVIAIVQRSVRFQSVGLIASMIGMVLLGLGIAGVFCNFVLGIAFGDPVISIVFAFLGIALAIWVKRESVQIGKMVNLD